VFDTEPHRSESWPNQTPISIEQQKRLISSWGCPSTWDIRLTLEMLWLAILGGNTYIFISACASSCVPLVIFSNYGFTLSRDPFPKENTKEPIPNVIKRWCKWIWVCPKCWGNPIPSTANHHFKKMSCTGRLNPIDTSISSHLPTGKPFPIIFPSDMASKSRKSRISSISAPEKPAGLVFPPGFLVFQPPVIPSFQWVSSVIQDHSHRWDATYTAQQPGDRVSEYTLYTYICAHIISYNIYIYYIYIYI
jgi:hypothetical protein